MSVRQTVKSIQDIMRKDAGVDGDAQRLSQLCWMFFLKIIDDQERQLSEKNDNYLSIIPSRLRWSKWAESSIEVNGTELLEFINCDLLPSLKSIDVKGEQSSRRRVVKDVFEDVHNYMKNGNLIRQVITKINEVDFNNLAERKHFGDIYEQMLNDLQAAGNSGEFYTPRALTAYMIDRLDPKLGEVIFDPSCGTGGFLTCSIRHVRNLYIKNKKDETKLESSLRAIELKQLPHMLCVTNMLLHGIKDASFVRHDNSLIKDYDSYTEADNVDVIATNPPFGASVPDGVEVNFPAKFRSKESADLFLVLIIKLLKKNGRAAVILPNGSLFGEGVKARIREHLLTECNLHTIIRLPDSVFKPYASIGTNILFFEKGIPTKKIWFYELSVPEGQKSYSMTRPIRLEHLQDCSNWWGGSKREGRIESNFAWQVDIDDIRANDFSLDYKNPYTAPKEYDDPEIISLALDEAELKLKALRKRLKSILKETLLP